MRLTDRDIRLIRDLALSHVMSRDQIKRLGYFGSTTRANSRLRGLCKQGIAAVYSTPFFGQFLYMAGCKASKVVGERIAHLLAGRRHSPQFLRHALCTNDVRIALTERGATGWQFEQQLWRTFTHLGEQLEVRPDGLATFPERSVFVEVDLGHVPPTKFGAKLRSYDLFTRSGGTPSTTTSLLVVTTGSKRARSLRRQLPTDPSFDFDCQTFDDLGIIPPGNWS